MSGEPAIVGLALVGVVAACSEGGMVGSFAIKLFSGFGFSGLEALFNGVFRIFLRRLHRNFFSVLAHRLDPVDLDAHRVTCFFFTLVGRVVGAFRNLLEVNVGRAMLW